jgi:hypothetical protein
VAVGVTVNVYDPTGVTTGGTGGGAGLCCAVLEVPATLPHPVIHRKIIPARHACSTRMRHPLAATPIMQSASIAITPQRVTIRPRLSSSRDHLSAIVLEEIVPAKVVAPRLVADEITAEEAAPDVVTLTVKFTAAPFVTLTELGALQFAPVGAPVHAKLNVPVKPLPPVA